MEANAFKSLRERTNLRQADVAESLGVAQTTVSMWETGDSMPRASLLVQLAQLYHCSIDALLGREEAST